MRKVPRRSRALRCVPRCRLTFSSRSLTLLIRSPIMRLVQFDLRLARAAAGTDAATSGAPGGSSAAPGAWPCIADVPVPLAACLHGSARDGRRCPGSGMCGRQLPLPGVAPGCAAVPGSGPGRKITPWAPVAATSALISSALPLPMKSAGSGARRRAMTRATTSSPAEAASKREFVQRPRRKTDRHQSRRRPARLASALRRA